jgi:peptide/nickel transport system substrate-binding protein
MKVHKPRLLVTGIAVVALATAACGSGGGGSSSKTNADGTRGTGHFAKCATSPNDCNSGSVAKGGSITYTLEKTMAGWNVNSATTSTFETAEVMDGILPAVFTADPDLLPALNTDLMVSAKQIKTNPQTLVYKIRPDAVWSDGTPIDAKDFDYFWKTSDGIHCPDCGPAITSGYNQIKSLTPSAGGKTVTIVMRTPYSDWQSMFPTMYPAHIAAQHGDLTTAKGLAKSFKWFDTTQPSYSGGPYLISGKADKLTAVTEVPNPKWYGKVKPSLARLVFRIITDQTQEVPALQNHEVQAIYPQPDADITGAVAKLEGQGIDSYLGKGLQWEHLDFNETNALLKDKTLRTAIFTAVDRKQVIAKTIGQFVPKAKPLNSHMYVPGQPGYQDNVSSTGQGSGDVAKAKKMLTAAGYTGVGSKLKNKAGQTVKLRCAYTAGNQLRQQSCVLVQSELAALGIAVKPVPLDDLGGTLESGDFDMIIYAWVGTPFVVSGAQQIFKLKGGSDFGKNNDPAVERLLDAGSTATDPATVHDDLNKADKLLTADAYELPLFQKPTFLAAQANIANLRDNATSVGPPYNLQSWGIRSS